MTHSDRLRTTEIMLSAVIIVVPVWSQAAEQPSTEEAKTVPMRPHLGARVTSAGQLAARQLGIESPVGAVVLTTDVAGPADTAGLVRGDRIVEFAGREIRKVDDLADELAKSPIGSEQTIAFVRKSELITRRVVIGGEAVADDATSSPAPKSTNLTPNTSPTGPTPQPSEPQPPAGWSREEVGGLVVYLPPDWTSVPFLASDEGYWFHGSEDAKRAVFAVIRDLPKDELLKPMKIERREPTTLAGRAALAYGGPTIDQGLRGYGVVVIPDKPEADGSLLALLCFSEGSRRAEYEATFEIILRQVRNRSAKR